MGGLDDSFIGLMISESERVRMPIMLAKATTNPDEPKIL